MAGEDRTGERIAKLMARAGLCSRREAERWIAAGRVAVDGEILTGPAVVVPPDAVVTVDGRTLAPPAKTRLWRYHKPRGLLTTHADPQGRPTVFDTLPKGLPRLIAIGRLDVASEGLLLLTNDGALARHLELPRTGWTRRYRVRVHGAVDPQRLAALAGGVTVSGTEAQRTSKIEYGPIEAVLDRQTGANAWLKIALREGKNREVRRVMEHLGYRVNRLIRIAFGPFQLGSLPPGALEEVPARVGADQLPQFFDRTQSHASRSAAPPSKRPRKTGGHRAARPLAQPRGKSSRSTGGHRSGGNTKPSHRRR